MIDGTINIFEKIWKLVNKAAKMENFEFKKINKEIYEIRNKQLSMVKNLNTKILSIASYVFNFRNYSTR